MKMLKVNRKHFVNLLNVEKFVYRDGIVWIYRKEGFPRVYKTDYAPYNLRVLLTNLGHTIQEFKVE